MTDQFIDNTKNGRFEYHVGSGMVFANYRQKNGVLFIDYVEAPPELRGTGASGKLMQHIMENARKDGFKVTPICGYAGSWLRRHSEHEDLLA